MIIVRAALLVLALACCAWYVLGIRQAHETGAATAIASQQTPLSAAQVKRANSLLSAAATLNPDQQVTVLRGELAVDQGHYAQARRILHPVITREVNNLQAWLMYGRAAGNNLILAEQAHYVVTRLVRIFPAQ